MLLHDLLTSHRTDVARRPVLARADERRVLSIADLKERAEAYAAYYQRLGLGPGDRVAIVADKSPDVIAAFIGASIAAVTYLPLDPKAPPAHWGQVLSDLSVNVLLSDRTASSTSLGAVRVVGMLPKEGGVPGWDKAKKQTPCEPAYILTTSGSTGRPKGVVLSHENALAFVRWAARTVELGPDDVILNVSPFHFDLSVFDVYASLMTGARLIIAPAAAAIFPGELLRLIEQHGVTILYSVPTTLRPLADANGLGGVEFRSLRAILYAGEPFPVPELRRLMRKLQHVTFHNFFGPTETNVCLAHRFLGPPGTDAEDVPIGAPASGARISLLDEAGAVVVDGEVGEIVVDGSSVMLGYLSKAGFAPAERPYRTGDFAVKAADGLYYFRGRRDQQVKVRGNRVELQAIERVLQTFPGIREVAVLVGHDRLIAFISGEDDLDVRDLRSTCAQALPPGSVPHEFQFLTGLPRLTNGKLDRQRLEQHAGIARASGS